MSTITIMTLVHDVREQLPRCLESVSWADEILCVVDTSTTDGSDEIAKKYTENVQYHEFVNVMQQRIWALSQITTEWTLVLDSDEWVSEELQLKILAIIMNPTSKSFYTIRRQSYFFGKLIKHCGWHRDYNLRLYRTKDGEYEPRHAHEKMKVTGPVGQIHESMYHNAYDTLDDYFVTFQKYTTGGAQDAFERRKRARLTDLTLRPLLRFFKMYVLRHGFLDGLHGAVLCGLGACNVFIKYTKLWQLQRRQENQTPRDNPKDDP